ncbi:RES family NAD+ phosphorylase [Paraglaciecola hydrolytica]|uniref:RES domain-containing protein n=1 Tax=Paraglaciecola hydrolytica TaxID=1799789 RepID=A0A148KLW4_9ALTE|nr:RES family NAD+ phosphorylase [Paraglaciecola hydrolytica]KXI27314.1 hypothetical protein AX660_21555 [Paraglaciecola hydrolytica]
MPILDEFKGLYQQSPCPLSYRAWVKRLVETQQVAATTQLVDDLDEQYLLEQMLDEVKPCYREGTEHMHYLLKTPFRYPPLKYGSRFGTRLLPSFFYASEDEHACLGEVAYYRFVFLHHMQVAYDKPIRSQHMMFNLEVKTSNCADLSLDDFASVKSTLLDPSQYLFSQAVGHYLQAQAQVDVIRYPSARIENGINIAIVNPQAIISTEPESCQNWLCLTLTDKVSFTQSARSLPLTFYREDFLLDGHIPMPA